MLGPFREVWAADFEFVAHPGERPDVVCLVARELKSGRVIRLWRDQLGPVPPYATGPDTLLVAYYASAELGCHRALGWPTPARVLDLFTEFRARRNGLATVAGSGLLGALTHFGLDNIGATEKEGMRELILTGGPWSAQQQADIIAYCESDVLALERLLVAMLPGIDLPRALLRGRYMAAAAAMEHSGVPIDIEMLGIAARELAAHPGPADRRHQLPIRRLRRPDIQSGPVRWLAGCQQYPLAAAGERPPGSGRRHLPADGAGLSRGRAIAGATQLACRTAVVGLGGRSRWSQPHDPVCVQVPHRAQSAVKFPVHLRAGGVAAKPDQAAAGLGGGLYRLVTAGIRYCRRPIRRRCHASGLSLRRSLSRIRQASRRRAGGCDQENA